MEWWLFLLLVFSLVFKFSHAVRCYHCAADPLDSDPCELFDRSDRFIKDCPDSTVCLKKIVAMPGVNVNGVAARYCAPQILKNDYEKVNKSWRPIKRIYEPYRESCEEDKQEGRITKTILCACRGDLCNHSAKLGGSSVVKFGLIALVIFGVGYDWL